MRSPQGRETLPVRAVAPVAAVDHGQAGRLQGFYHGTMIDHDENVVSILDDDGHVISMSVTVGTGFPRTVNAITRTG